MTEEQENELIGDVRELKTIFREIQTIARSIHGVCLKFKDKMKEQDNRAKSPHMTGKEDGQ